MNRYARSFRSLIVWREAKKYTLKIYQLTKSFPQQELYGLSSQLRRASSSVMANIAEGNERYSQNDRLHFFSMARSSLVETDCHLELAYDLGYLNDKDYSEILNHLNQTGYLLAKFITSNHQTPSLRSLRT